METKRDLVKLKDCPVGFFIYKGTFCFKTGYAETVNGVLSHDAYICESGEFFWGGAKKGRRKRKFISKTYRH